ncbi:hypothetical protein [Tsukamurella paurometabola]|uniref:Uncharacterized protein n=1 Tax=Tsukamurella paurometabola TaxID=2061 RepID=A0A3P8KT27_TSUPA|nr:hypothetical protein [Tsukamurella paurometabola]UEA82815.1 hypothetical protein LK411_21030 [Tsukamurella paurometabola]VDR39887.1 Uncharacterised protein [Tsukamurella paurometabola]
MVIETPWVELADVAASSVSGWRAVWVVVGIAVAFLPIVVWKARWAERWQWWKSVLFFVAWFCVGVPIAAVIAGDTHSSAHADDVLTRALTAQPAVLQPGSVVVEQSDHSAGTSMHAPYQGEETDYTVAFSVIAADRLSRCEGTVTLKRNNAPRGRNAPVFARLRANCASAPVSPAPAAP